MKRIYFYIAILSLVLASCGDENWFYHSVKYKGDVEQPKLFLAAQLQANVPPMIFVMRSYFFQDGNRFDSIVERYHNYHGGYTEYIDTYPKDGYVHNAEVRMCVNGDKWYTLVCHEVTDSIYRYQDRSIDSKRCFYTCDYTPRSGDRVRIEVECSGYKSVCTEQCIPFEFPVEITDLDTTSVFGMAFFNVHFPSEYQGDMTDFVHVLGHTDYHYDFIFKKYRYIVVAGKYIAIPDGEERNTRHNGIDFLYAQDLAFSKCIPAKPMVKGYYGSDEHGLYAPIGDLLGKTVPMAMVCPPAFAAYFPDRRGDLYGYHVDKDDEVDKYPEDADERYEIFLDSLVFDCEVVSRDSYLYLASRYQKTKWYSYIPDFIDASVTFEYGYPSAEGGSGGYGDIYGDITDMFDEMGMQEDVQLYSNVWLTTGEPTFGHVESASGSCTQILARIVREKTDSTTNKE